MTKNVYKLIAEVSAEMGRDGISKSRKNQQQGYAFRGIDEVLNALSPVISKHGLVIIPRCVEREMTERQTKTGSPLFYVVVTAEFDFVSSHDGSMHTVRTYGEAMDSADKATNKAMSAAYKYAAFQTFCIPTEGDNDADAHTPEPKAEPKMTPEQCASVMALADGAGVAVKAICDGFKVSALSDIRASAYEKIVSRLQDKMKEAEHANN